MREAFRRRKGYSPDSGFTLTELLVSVMVMAILLTMISVTVDLVFKQTTAQTQRVNSGSNAETTLWALKVPLRYAVTPYTAASSIPGYGAPTTTSPCWGKLPPAFYPVMPGLPAYPPGPSPLYAAVTGTTGGSALYSSLFSPQDNSLLMAHDFDIVFCAPVAYSSYSTGSVPKIYRLWINPTTCTDHTVTGGGSCTLELDNYDVVPSTGAGSCAFPNNPVPTSVSTCSNPPPLPLSRTAVATNVWCNLSCQEDVVGNLGSNSLTTTPLFTYYSVPNAPTVTPIVTSDVKSPTGANLVGIHDVSVSVSALSGRPSAPATAISGVSTSQFSVYMGGTVGLSSTILDSAPVVTSVTPTAPAVACGSLACGPTTGGTSGNPGGTVTITGQFFDTTTAVTFGGTPATSYTIPPGTSTSITAVPPAHSAGLVDVQITNANGKSVISTADNFEYFPTVTGVSPTSGTAGTTVTISGAGFATGATVSFGTVPAIVTAPITSTQITVTAPAVTAATVLDPAGSATVDVTVTVASATSLTSSSDLFKNVPTVGVGGLTGISPSTGLQGTVVDITGTDFLTGATVKFGSNAATSVTVVSPTEITATAPNGPVPFGTGIVDVTVTDAGGTSATSASDKFTYSPL
jgi:prepilin-type N-terminal cleavage/methylation domain-containing protein